MFNLRFGLRVKENFRILLAQGKGGGARIVKSEVDVTEPLKNLVYTSNYMYVSLCGWMILLNVHIVE